MSDGFTTTQERFLTSERMLGRVATVGRDGVPHVSPVGMWSLNKGVIEVRGRDLTATKKFRDVARSGTAAISIDDVSGGGTWSPRAVLVRGRAEAIDRDDPVIRIYPDRVVSWGLDQYEQTYEKEKEA